MPPLTDGAAHFLRRSARRVSGTSRSHSSLLRGGGGGAWVVPASRERGDVNLGPGWALRAGRPRAKSDADGIGWAGF